MLKQLKLCNKISATTLESQILLDPSKFNVVRLTFQVSSANGHMGARKFWQTYLPTLKFYNPTLNIQVNRINNTNKNTKVPCILEIVKANGEVTETIEMSGKRSEDIMNEFLKVVDHEKVPSEQIVKL
ncbi:mitochondrial 54S ribosomal protein mL61 Ecym_8096 [Eremothecium cymbalariae DBVPG|uniref:Ribosomal protein/NADH dehydrogenase domain-containing protein n=1 Tax=Eremothecium cymbalariae (strain CBS 270.75 / DBVPG 7215 / KCTC 17166 / NRRL Y-17582) TaxID=931890 RepID=G8JX16_ERECY|nr:Hypothetical protein Ecym_8096 [Eremothecium cymbalariae DBVPG\